MSQYVDFSPVIAGVMRWGIWGARLDTDAMAHMISSCVEMGVSSFDHADIYGDYTTEEEFGRAFKKSGIARDKIQLITKCGIMRPCLQRPEYKVKHYNTSKEHITQSVHQSLKNLRTDYLDVLLIHRPSPLMLYEEIAAAFSRLAESGMVRAFGVSNFLPHQTDMLAACFPLVTNQVEFSLVHTAPLYDGTTESCQRNRMKITAWSPLGGKTLFDGGRDDLMRKLTDYAEAHGWTFVQMALAFLLHHPAGIIPVIGTSRVDGVRESVESLRIKMTDEQWFEILRIVNGKDVP